MPMELHPCKDEVLGSSPGGPPKIDEGHSSMDRARLVFHQFLSALPKSLMGIESLITEALQLPGDLISYHVARGLAEVYPEETILEGQNWYFDLDAFARVDKCFIVEERSVFNQVRTSWEGVQKKQKKCFENPWIKVVSRLLI